MEVSAIIQNTLQANNNHGYDTENNGFCLFMMIATPNAIKTIIKTMAIMLKRPLAVFHV